MERLERGQMSPIDVMMIILVLIVMVMTAPIWFRFADMINSVAGPLTATILALFIPLLFLMILIGAGASARRRLS